MRKEEFHFKFGPENVPFPVPDLWLVLCRDILGFWDGEQDQSWLLVCEDVDDAEVAVAVYAVAEEEE